MPEHFQIFPARVLTVICVMAFVCFAGNNVHANERMAGGKKYTAEYSYKTSKDLNAPYSGQYTLPSQAYLNSIEQLGLFTTSMSGGLGIDMWYGTTRQEATALLIDLPDESAYRTLNLLSLRLLQTAADPEYLQDDKMPDPGYDLLTLRLEKLIKRGRFNDAAKIYKEIPGEPYHPKLAEAGITALLLEQQFHMGCMETLALSHLWSAETSFPVRARKICQRVLSEHQVFETNQEESEENKSDEHPENRDLSLLDQALSNPDFILKPKSAEELNILAPLTLAYLISQDKIDLQDLGIKEEMAGLNPYILTGIVKMPGVSAAHKEKALALMLEKGLIQSGEVKTFLQSSLQEGHSRNARLDILSSDTEDIDDAVLEQHFIKELPDRLSALQWPLSERLTNRLNSENESKVAPQEFFEKLELFGLTEHKMTTKLWKTTYENISALQGKLSPKQYALIMALPYLPKKNSDDDFVLKAPPAHVLQGHLPVFILHRIIDSYEKLDIYYKDAIYASSVSYENYADLTTSDNYVMPSSALMDGLSPAAKNKKLAEVVLKSCLLTSGMMPSEVNRDVFRTIIDSLVNVGLTREAQKLAVEAIMGLRE